MRKAPEVKLSEAEQRELERWTRATTLPVRQVVRARVLLLAGQGADDTVIADSLGITRQRSGRIRDRYLKGGLKALEGDLPRSGRPHQCAKDRRVDYGKDAGIRDRLEPRVDGEDCRDQRFQCWKDMA